jgi:S-adenosyl methyltransferase
MADGRAALSLAAEAPARSAVDASRPNIARVYDFLLGGKDNYAADRAEAARLLAIYPRLPHHSGGHVLAAVARTPTAGT